MAGNSMDMGLRLNPQNALRGLRNVRFAAYTLLCGFLLCPALAYGITRVIPLASPYATGLILLGMTPCAPFLPAIVSRAKGDLGFTAAFMLLTAGISRWSARLIAFPNTNHLIPSPITSDLMMPNTTKPWRTSHAKPNEQNNRRINPVQSNPLLDRHRSCGFYSAGLRANESDLPKRICERCRQECRWRSAGKG